MRIIWSPEAIRDLTQIRAYIAQDNPAAAKAVVARIVSLVTQHLPKRPRLGRPGRVPGTRELVVAKTPFVIPYRLRNKTIEIIRVYHSARRWPESL